MQPFRIYAHRGANRELPENTLEAFGRALELGVDALETDVHLTRDGVVVVHHDSSALRTCGVNARVAEVDASELERWDAGWGHRRAGGHAEGRFRVPRLSQLLMETQGVAINVDIKVSPGRFGLGGAAREAVAKVVACVREARAEDRVTLTSVSDAVSDEVRRLGYGGMTGLGKRAALGFVLWPLPTLGRRPAGQALQLPWRYGGLRFDRASVVRRAQALGLRVDYWTVNEPELARRLVGLGVDGIMTDDPAAVLAAIREARAARGGAPRGG